MSYASGTYLRPVYQTPSYASAQYLKYTGTRTAPATLYGGCAYPSGLPPTTVAPGMSYSRSYATRRPSDHHASTSRSNVDSSSIARRARESQQTVHSKSRVKVEKPSTGGGMPKIQLAQGSRSRSRSRVRVSSRSHTGSVSGASAPHKAHSRSRTRGRRSSTAARDATRHESSTEQHHPRESRPTSGDRRKSRSRGRRSSHTTGQSLRSTPREATVQKPSTVDPDRSETVSTRTYDVKVGVKERVRILHSKREPLVHQVSKPPPVPSSQVKPRLQAPFPFQYLQHGYAPSRVASASKPGVIAHTSPQHRGLYHVSSSRGHGTTPPLHPHNNHSPVARTGPVPDQQTPGAKLLHIIPAGSASHRYDIALPIQTGVPPGSTFAPLPPIVSGPCYGDANVSSKPVASDNVRSSPQVKKEGHDTPRSATSSSVLNDADGRVPKSSANTCSKPGVHSPAQSPAPKVTHDVRADPKPGKTTLELARSRLRSCHQPESPSAKWLRPPGKLNEMQSIVYSPSPRKAPFHLEPRSEPGSASQTPRKLPMSVSAPWSSGVSVPTIMLSSPTPPCHSIADRHPSADNRRRSTDKNFLSPNPLPPLVAPT